jgi:hypothetical protein
VKTHGEMNHRPGARLSAGSQTVLPTVRFWPATSVEFTPAANTHLRRAKNAIQGPHTESACPKPPTRRSCWRTNGAGLLRRWCARFGPHSRTLECCVGRLGRVVLARSSRSRPSRGGRQAPRVHRTARSRSIACCPWGSVHKSDPRPSEIRCPMGGPAPRAHKMARAARCGGWTKRARMSPWALAYVVTP